MAENDIHYLVGTQDEPVSHIHAVDQEAAIKEFVNGGNWNGYEAEEFDGEDIIIVAYAKVQVYVTEIVPPVEQEISITKVDRS